MMYFKISNHTDGRHHLLGFSTKHSFDSVRHRFRPMRKCSRGYANKILATGLFELEWPEEEFNARDNIMLLKEGYQDDSRPSIYYIDEKNNLCDA